MHFKYLVFPYTFYTLKKTNKGAYKHGKNHT